MDRDYFQKIPKADLHVHLNGLFNSQLVHQILLEEGVELLVLFFWRTLNLPVLTILKTQKFRLFSGWLRPRP